jgi:hypothetical protein
MKMNKDRGLFKATMKIKGKQACLKPALSLYDASAINVGAILVVSGILAGLAGGILGHWYRNPDNRLVIL